MGMTMSPGREEGKRRGGCMFPSPTSQIECGAIIRESIAVQPQNKCAIHWLSYLLRTGILCWASYTLHRGQEPLYQE